MIKAGNRAANFGDDDRAGQERRTMPSIFALFSLSTLELAIQGLFSVSKKYLLLRKTTSV